MSQNDDPGKSVRVAVIYDIYPHVGVVTAWAGDSSLEVGQDMYLTYDVHDRIETLSSPNVPLTVESLTRLIGKDSRGRFQCSK
jgi:hypothetical protein